MIAIEFWNFKNRYTPGIIFEWYQPLGHQPYPFFNWIVRGWGLRIGRYGISLGTVKREVKK